MKQFSCTFQNGTTVPYTLAAVESRYPLSVAVIRKLAVGEQAVDRDGDMWTRLPDLAEETRRACDERLERIAAAALQGIMGSPAQCPMSAEAIASAAVHHAKALIAELDKQA